jgi:hypothetical protein
LTAQQLREEIEQFLCATVLRKSPDNRTQREEQLVEHGRAFADVLLRYAEGSMRPREYENAVTGLIAKANEINREADLRGVDAELYERVRNRRG